MKEKDKKVLFAKIHDPRVNSFVETAIYTSKQVSEHGYPYSDKQLYNYRVYTKETGKLVGPKHIIMNGNKIGYPKIFLDKCLSDQVINDVTAKFYEKLEDKMLKPARYLEKKKRKKNTKLFLVKGKKEAHN